MEYTNTCPNLNLPALFTFGLTSVRSLLLEVVGSSGDANVPCMGIMGIYE